MLPRYPAKELGYFDLKNHVLGDISIYIRHIFVQSCGEEGKGGGTLAKRKVSIF